MLFSCLFFCLCVVATVADWLVGWLGWFAARLLVWFSLLGSLPDPPIACGFLSGLSVGRAGAPTQGVSAHL